MKKIIALSSTLLALPLVAGAQVGSLDPVKHFIEVIGTLVLTAIPVLIGISLLAFFWGLFQYIRHPDHKIGTQTIIAGLVGLFVMVSVWGLIKVAQIAILGSGNNSSTQVNAPNFPRIQ